MGDNAQYIKTLAPNAIIENLDTLSIDGSIDLALRIIEQSGSLEVFDIRINKWIKDAIIQNLALALAIAEMPISDLRAMTEDDFKAAKEFLQRARDLSNRRKNK